MTKIITLFVATSFALSGTVEAANYRLPHRYQPAPPPRIAQHYPRANWIVPAAVLTVGGIALATAISRPSPVYVAPPPAYVMPPPPAGNWYYCRSSSQYYPYTNACPEGWQTVSPR
ncbi:MAG: hypothetical protein FWD50_05915 [Betaproteobacteria bacterium]|nr:hypothetical protein [Betaproteobacteria bacterium]